MTALRPPQPAVEAILVPTGLDPAKAMALLEEAAREETQTTERERLFQAALESDKGLRAWMLAEDYHAFAPIVRANVYGDESCICGSQIIPGKCAWSSDPRRPVLMRGSLDACIARYGWSNSHSPNGWCVAIVERYFRRTKFTCFDVDEFHVALYSVTRRLKEKCRGGFGKWRGEPEVRKPYYCLSYHFYQHWQWYGYYGQGTARVYLKGRRVRLTQVRYARWLEAREKRLRATLIEIPRRFSPDVAQRALKELGLFVPRRTAMGALRQILDQPVKELTNA